jgi:hypothetical protein
MLGCSADMIACAAIRVHRRHWVRRRPGTKLGARRIDQLVSAWQYV